MNNSLVFFTLGLRTRANLYGMPWCLDGKHRSFDCHVTCHTEGAFLQTVIEGGPWKVAETRKRKRDSRWPLSLWFVSSCGSAAPTPLPICDLIGHPFHDYMSNVHPKPTFLLLPILVQLTSITQKQNVSRLIHILWVSIAIRYEKSCF